MKTLKFLFQFLIAVCFILACSKDDDGGNAPTLSNEKQITSLQFLADDNVALSDDVTGTINENTKTITATVPYGTNTGALIPEIGVSAGASFSPGGAQDFTGSVTYTVTAEDGSTENYTVNVTFEENESKQITSFQFLAADNTALSDDVTGVINETEKTIVVEVPHGTHVSALIPDVVVSTAASFSPEGVQDFTSPVIYTVTAGNGSTEDYTVTITVNVSEVSILTSLFNENPGNTLGWDLTADMSTWEGVATNAEGNVTYLNLQDKNISFIPPQINRLTELYDLILNNNQISEIPVEIGQLNKLAYLDLAVNNLTSLPPEIGMLTELRSLNLQDNDLTSIPQEIGLLTNLEYLGIRNNDLTSLPAEIGQLTSIVTINASFNSLTSIPTEIGSLSSLKNFNLSQNSLTSLPEEIGELSNLINLQLNYNKLTSLPPEIGELTQLTYLPLGSNELTSIPGEIGQLSGLTTLLLEGNQLTSLPEEISQLTSLTSVDLYINNFTSVPPVLESLTSLTSLNFSINQITEIPEWISDLSGLTYLNFSGNNITSVPEEMGLLTNLETLALTENNITSIPQTVCDLETDHGTTIEIDAGVSCMP